MALRCDTIIRDATLIDGTGAARRTGDVGIRGERIVGVGDLGGWSADRGGGGRGPGGRAGLYRQPHA